MNTTYSSNSFRHIDLSPDLRSAGQARAFVSDTLSDWGYIDLEDDVALVVSELVTNAIVHCHSSTSLTLLDMKDDLQVRVSDTEPASPVMRDAGTEGLNGRGLRIISELAHQWGVEPQGTGKVVWLDITKHQMSDKDDSGDLISK